MNVSELETPALLIDLAVMERNLQRAADYTRKHGLRFRPHTKTHKIPALGRRQLDLGAVGLTVAKVGEAEVMLNASPGDLLVAYPVVGRSKLRRLMEVARHAQVTVTLDSIEAARQLSDAAREAQLTTGVLVEVDVGFERVGVSPQALPDLARRVARLPNLDLQGIAFFPGHILKLDEQSATALRDLGALVGSLIRDVERCGIPVRLVSGGSTPTMLLSHTIPGLTEIRAGTYIFNDRNTVNCGACLLEDCAASVLVTVISCNTRERVIVDAGSKAFSSDLPVAGSGVNFGFAKEAPEAEFYKISEEHGFLNVTRTDRDFSVGDRLRIIPNHVCSTVNLHEVAYGVRRSIVEQVWRVEARAKLT